MSDAARSHPWWWLTDDECRALGIGAAAHRTERGVVFGEASAPYRLEVVGAEHDAPVKIGPVALRLWGHGSETAGRTVLARAARLLAARRGVNFEPTATPTEDASTEDAMPIEVPSVCRRACVFCEVSRTEVTERRRYGSDEQVLSAIDAATAPVLFTGNDALSHPSIVAFVERARSRGHRPSLIGPPRRGTTAALAPALARAGLSKWSTSLLGSGAASHDPLAGESGSFEAVVESTAAFCAAGIAVEFVVPLIEPLLPRLSTIVATAFALSARAPTVLLFAPDPVVATAFDALVPRHPALRAALAAVPSDTGVDAVPLCLLPEARRATAKRTLARTAVELRAVHPGEPCGRCTERDGCPGVASTILRAVGSDGLVSLKRR